MNATDLSEIESGGKRWHGEDHRVIHVRWEPYKPDGQRQMKAKGRWQEQVGSGDYWRWQNCDRPQNLTASSATPAPLSDPRVKALVEHLKRWLELASHCSIEEGICCCGDNMDGHSDPMNCGHSPVGYGSYMAQRLVERTSAALAAFEEGRA